MGKKKRSLCPIWLFVSTSAPGSSVHESSQARRWEWVAISFSRGSSWPRDRTWTSYIAGRFSIMRASREAHFYGNKRKAKFSWLEEIINSVLSSEHSQLRRFLGLGLEASSDVEWGQRTGSVNLKNFFVSVWMFPVIGSGVLVNFLRGLHSRKHEVCPCVISFSDFFKVYIKPSSITLLDFTKKEVVFFLVFSDIKSRKYEENWEH